MKTNLNLWSDSHVFYSKYNQPYRNTASDEDIRESKNRFELISGSQNFHLVNKNGFFDDLKSKNKHYLAHITYGLDKLLESKSIYASGGCLVGSIYCVPITEQDGEFRLHNLGEYIYEKEAKILGEKDTEPQVLILEVDSENENQSNIIGIDYLRLGEIHKNIFSDLEYLLSFKERYELHSYVTRQIKESLDFLKLCSNIYYNNFQIKNSHFLECFRETQGRLPILGYLYFEVLIEYILFFQDNAESIKYSELGEFYNKSYKEMMYSLEPRLKSNFKLSSFSPSIEEISSYFKSTAIIKKFNAEHLQKYLCERLLNLIMSRLMPNTSSIDWENFEWNFDNVMDKVGNLAGHLIHRELRNYGRYPSLYYYFDQTKALQIWNYWNHMDVVIPFNGIVPKGEIGINPAYPDLKYKIHKGKVIREKDFILLTPDKELNISIEPRLVDLRYTTMRNKSDNVNLKT